MSFTNQTQTTALVTGSTRGIGKETTLLLLKKGLNVIISSRSQDSVDNVIEEILNKFPSKKEHILGLKCDVSKHSEVKTLVDVSVKRFGRIDVLVNNAGIVYFKSIMDTTEEEWDKTIDTNLKGVFLFTKEVLPYMIENKSGVIINVSSGAGKYGFPNLSAYCASKFGVIGLTESVAKEVTDYNVKIMAICPGGVDTKMIKDIVKVGYNASNRNLITPEEVANKIYDMIFNQNGYYNGQSVEFYNK
ncbi:MAG: glucose/ribitol dehydrogenase family protein [Nitrososphaeraceae archaeon]|nr:glucose/ribitol dehydrogenase family protein [Nitrososphaeraceae archaeon]